MLWTLCEASDKALMTFNNGNLMQILFLHLDVTKFGYDVVSTVLQCIYSVSEDNVSAVEAVREKEAIFTTLLSATNEANGEAAKLYVRLLTCGVIVNATSDVSSLGALHVIMETISDVLDQDQRKLVSCVKQLSA